MGGAMHAAVDRTVHGRRVEGNSNMAKTCAELFEGIPHTLIGDPDEAVEGLSCNSAQVKPHDMFFCIVGTKIDGHTFAQDAIDKGAKVLVCERKLYLADASDVTLVVVSDSRRVMAEVASAFYDHPSEKLKLVGITGTNGKTTTTYLVDHIARFAGKTTGLIGTVGIHIAGAAEKSSHTTPDSIELQELLARMVDVGCDVVSMEVSSHALDLDRVWASKFAVTAFTNLTQDHLDYHKTFEEYFAVKSRLFSDEYPSKRVIGTNEKWGRKLACRCIDGGDDVITFSSARQEAGESGGASEDRRPATIHVLDVEYLPTSTKATLSIDGATHVVTYPLTGRFNVDNVMCAIGACLDLGLDLPVIIDGLKSAPAVPGRMQRIEGATPAGVAADFSVVVDYAHTPDALEKAIASVREVADGRVILVFGCEGDRDNGKRPIMGRISLGADKVVLTTDNTHTDDQAKINDQVISGMLEVAGETDIARDAAPGIDTGSKVTVIEDRRSAMEHAMSVAQPGDVVLITGRGHEQYMEFGRERIFFDDRDEAREALDAVMARKARH